MTSLLHPLTRPDCDLRDFSFMPLDVVRLRDSELSALSSGDEFRCAVLLWCASWHQIPAASLPDDDVILSQLAGFGRVVKEWRKVRVGSLRGWVKCADGRLYHPVVAEKARDAWTAKLKQRWVTECARVKKHCQRHKIDPPLSVPDFDEWLSLDCPQGHALLVPGDMAQESPGTLDGCPDAVPRETASKGEGYREGYRDIDKESHHKGVSGTDTQVLNDDDCPVSWEGWRQWFEAECGIEHDPYSRHDRAKLKPLASAWCAAGVSIGQMRRAIAKARAEATQPIAYLPAYVDRVLSTITAAPAAASKAELAALTSGFMTGAVSLDAPFSDPPSQAETIDVESRVVAP